MNDLYILIQKNHIYTCWLASILGETFVAGFKKPPAGKTPVFSAKGFISAALRFPEPLRFSALNTAVISWSLLGMVVALEAPWPFGTAGAAFGVQHAQTEEDMKGKYAQKWHYPASLLDYFIHPWLYVGYPHIIL